MVESLELLDTNVSTVVFKYEDIMRYFLFDLCNSLDDKKY